jgi:hypothetical protein
MSAARRWAAALSVVAHGGLALLLFTLTPDISAPDVGLPPMSVTLLTLPPPPQPPPPLVQSRPRPSPAAASPPRARRVIEEVPAFVTPRMALEGPTVISADMAEGDLVGAATVGSGEGPGDDCNLPARLQRALRRDARVQAAVSEVHRGRALRVWNGDWVRHPGQEGAGLAAVREAIVWEVGFAPEDCRREPMRGLIVLSLSDGPGAARLAIGGGSWRWTDLLFARSSAVRR